MEQHAAVHVPVELSSEIRYNNMCAAEQQQIFSRSRKGRPSRYNNIRCILFKSQLGRYADGSSHKSEIIIFLFSSLNADEQKPRSE